MSPLQQLQHAFMDYLLASAAVDTKPTLEQITQTFKDKIAKQGGINADIRMQIYANAYRIRLTETLETDHEVLGIYLGDELFERMAKGYIASQPSAFTSLRSFADALPDYLTQDAFFSQYPIIADIARFERRLLNAFDAFDSERATFARLQALPAEQWPGCQLRFHPSVQLFQCNSNAVETWQALKQQASPPSPDYQGKRAWLLWRGESRLTEFISLSEYQLALLLGFIGGATFAEQCEMMLAFFSDTQAPMQVLQALQAWFQMGLIHDIA